MTKEAIRTYENVSPEFFRQEIQPLRRPAIVRGFDLGPCVQKWHRVEYIKQKEEDRPMKVHLSKEPLMDFRLKNFRYAVMSFYDLLEKAAGPGKDGDELVYLRALGGDEARGKDATLFQRDFPSLQEDFQPPPLFEPEKLFSSVLRVSSADVSVWTHYDITDNVYFQIVGQKRVLMWAPDQALNMYLDGDKSQVTNVDDPDLDQFPKFALTKQYEGILQPGDTLFIPSMWFHNMKALDFGIAINMFWKNFDLKLYDKKDPYGNKDLLPAAKSLRMLDNVIRQLDELPSEIKDFYARLLILKLSKKCLNE